MGKVIALILLVAIGTVALLSGQWVENVAAGSSINGWPPSVGQPYPNLALVNSEGKEVHLESFKGKFLLIEPLGMPCTACQAFSGGNKVGGFAGVTPQGNLKSIEEYLSEYGGGLTLNRDDLIFIQILFYSMSMKAPTPEDLRAWSAHFGFDKKKNVVVLGGRPEHINSGTYGLIPGLQLVDKDFILRSDGAGHERQMKMFTELIPLLGRLTRGEGR